MNYQALILIILNGALFGSLSVASRFSLGQFDAFTYNSLRLLIASGAYLSLYVVGGKKRQWPKDPVLWKRSVLYGIIGDGMQVSLIVMSMQYISSGLAATLITFFPVVMVILAHFFLSDERLTRGKVLGITVAMCGTLLMAFMGETGIAGAQSGSGWPGYLCMFGAAIIAGAASIYARKQMGGFDTFQTTSVRMFSAAGFVTIIAFLLGGMDFSRVNLTGVIVLFYAAFVVFSAFFISFVIIKRFGVTSLAISNYIQPLVAGLGGVILLHETITPVMLCGLGLILAGVMLINRAALKHT